MADSFKQFEATGRLSTTKLSPSEKGTVAFLSESKYETKLCSKCKEHKTANHFSAMKRQPYSATVFRNWVGVCNQCHIESKQNPSFLQEPLLWQQDSACTSAPDSEIFFPTSKADAKILEEEYLKYCTECPVKERCGEWGRHSGSGGVWGGEFLSYTGRGKK